MTEKDVKGEPVFGILFKALLTGDYSLLDILEEIPDGEVKDFYLALRNELVKLIDKQKRLLNQRYRLKPLPEGPPSEVDSLLLKRFKEKGYGEDIIHRTRKIWQDFVATAKHSIKDPHPWVSALDYLVRNFSEMGDDRSNRVTQRFLAQEYGIKSSQINMCYKEITKSIKIDHYFSRDERIELTRRFMKTIFRLARKYPKIFSKAGLETMKAQEEEFDRFYNIFSTISSSRK